MYAIKELYALLTISTLISSCVLFHFISTKFSSRSLQLWTVGMFVLFTGQMLMTLRGYVPFYISIIAGNTLSLFGLMLFWLGIRLYSNAQIHWKNYALMLACILCAIYFLYWFSAVKFNVAARIVTMNVLVLPFSTMIGYTLIYSSAPSRPALVFGIVNIGTTLSSIIRILTVLISPQHQSFFMSGWQTGMHTLWMIGYIITAAITFPLLALHKQKKAVLTKSYSHTL